MKESKSSPPSSSTVRKPGNVDATGVQDSRVSVKDDRRQSAK